MSSFSTHEHTALTRKGRPSRNFGLLAQVRPRARSISVPAGHIAPIAAGDHITLTIKHRFHGAGNTPRTQLHVAIGGWTTTDNTLVADDTNQCLRIVTPRGWIVEVSLSAWQTLLAKSIDAATDLDVPIPTAYALGCINAVTERCYA